MQRFGLAGIALSLRHIIGSVNTFLLSPVLLKSFGFELGVGAMFLIEIVLVYIFIRLYDLTKVDWFSVEYIKKVRDKFEIVSESVHPWIKRIAKINENEELVLVVILMIIDPMVLVLYVREGYFKFDGIKSKKVQFFFIVSAFVSKLVLAYVLKGMYLLVLFLLTFI